MKVAVLGAGNVGSALTERLAKAGHSVSLACTDPQKAKQVAESAGGAARGAIDNADAVTGAEVVILAVPYSAMPGVMKELGDRVDGKVLVDVSNRVGGAPGSTIDGTSAAEQLQEKHPRSTVVKAFNTLFASTQRAAQTGGLPLDVLVAADDATAKTKVMELSRSIGMRPLDAGPLAMARALEAMGLLNISMNRINKWPWQTAWKLVGPGPE